MVILCLPHVRMFPPPIADTFPSTLVLLHATGILLGTCLYLGPDIERNQETAVPQHDIRSSE